MALSAFVHKLHGQGADHGGDVLSFFGAENIYGFSENFPEDFNLLRTVAEAGLPQRGEAGKLLTPGAEDHSGISSARYFSSRMSGV